MNLYDKLPETIESVRDMSFWFKCRYKIKVVWSEFEWTENYFEIENYGGLYVKFELDREQYGTLIDALCSAYVTADKFYREEREKNPNVSAVLEKERDNFEIVMEALEEQFPEEWKEEEGL